METPDPYAAVRNGARPEARHGSAGVGARIRRPSRPEAHHAWEREAARAPASSAPAPAAVAVAVADEPDPVAGPSRGADGGRPGIPMDVLSLLRLLVRHARVTGPAVLLSLVALLVAVQQSSPTYQATGSVALLSPPAPPEVSVTPGSEPPPAVGQNPFVRYGDLSVMADILARIVAGESGRAELRAQGVESYEVVANRYQRGPVVEVTGEGPTAAAAVGSAEAALTEVDAVLAEVQLAEGADPEYFIKTAPLEAPSKAIPQYGSTVRVAIATLVVGALGTLGVAVLAETLARRRATRPVPPVGGLETSVAVADGPGPWRFPITGRLGGDRGRNVPPPTGREP